jgi:hypothetical protein
LVGDGFLISDTRMLGSAKTLLSGVLDTSKRPLERQHPKLQRRRALVGQPA